MEDHHQANSKNFNRCMVFLRHSKLKQSDNKLKQLANDFDQDPLAIKLLISYLEHWYDNQLTGLEQIPILHNTQEQQQDRSLRRLLSAFDYKFSGSAESTLLHLLSLSNKPIPLLEMQQIFHRNPVTRILSRGDEYQEFLAPLNKLNSKSWRQLLENLQALNLLQYTKSAQGALLSLEHLGGNP